MVSIFDRRVPQPNEYDAYGVPDEIGACVDALLAERTDCPDAIVEVIDGAILRMLEPWNRRGYGGDAVESIGSLHPIDVDVMLFLTLKPGVVYRTELGGAHAKEEIQGDAETLCEKLIAHGYQVVATQTPNGRWIRAVKGGFEVQPRNDNYWIKVRTLSQALTAFERPELYRHEDGRTR